MTRRPSVRPARRAAGGLPSPGVELGRGLVRRFGAFAARLAAGREREDVGRRRALQGEGEEFVGHRPYRLGDDLRHLDWSLLARRNDRPFVRVHRANAAESWLVAIDTSASMGIGRPGKLQSAAEAAAAAITLGLRLGSRIELLSPGPEGERLVELRRTSDLQRALGALEELVAGGGDPPSWTVSGALHGAPESAPLLQRVERAGRVLLFSDFLDVDARWVATLGRGRRHVHLGQVFAPDEWDPRAALEEGGEVIDPEAPETPWSAGPSAVPAYLSSLERFVEGWARLARDHRMSHAVWRSDEAFEDHVPVLLR